MTCPTREKALKASWPSPWRRCSTVKHNRTVQYLVAPGSTQHSPRGKVREAFVRCREGDHCVPLVVMNAIEVSRVVDKLQKIRALTRAREYVRPFERELYGEAAKAAAPAGIPRRFLSGSSRCGPYE